VLVSVTPIDSQSVQVTWRAPTQPNGVLISYTIRYTAGDKINEVTVHGNVSIFTKLHPYQNIVIINQSKYLVDCFNRISVHTYNML